MWGVGNRCATSMAGLAAVPWHRWIPRAELPNPLGMGPVVALHWPETWGHPLWKCSEMGSVAHTEWGSGAAQLPVAIGWTGTDWEGTEHILPRKLRLLSVTLMLVAPAGILVTFMYPK